MKQNITPNATQIDIGIKKMLIYEYEYNDEMFNVITKSLYGVNWLSKDESLTKKWLSFKIGKLSNDDLNIILRWYSNFTNITNIYKIFDIYLNDLFHIVEHFVWATWLYL